MSRERSTKKFQNASFATHTRTNRIRRRRLIRAAHGRPGQRHLESAAHLSGSWREAAATERDGLAQHRVRFAGHFDGGWRSGKAARRGAAERLAALGGGAREMAQLAFVNEICDGLQ